MKLLVTVLITLIVAVSIALVVIENPGYVLVAVGSWTVETTLALSAIVAILAFAALYYTIRFFKGMLGVPGGLRHWRQRRRERKAMMSLTRGLIDLAEGHWQSSEKHILKYVNDSHAPLLNYLGAARAAQAQGADQRRDNYLKQAHESYSGADIAVGLTQAELQLQHQQLEQALATLRHLQQLAPKHTQVLKVLAKLYEELEDWEHLLELMPQLRKRHVYSGEEIEKMSRMAYLALLNSSTGHEDETELDGASSSSKKSESLKLVWDRIPKHFREYEEILLRYVQHLVEYGETAQLEPLIRSSLKKNRNEALIYYYGLVRSADSNRHLSMAESLLIGHEKDAATLLTVGRLSMRNKLWGKARSYLEASIHSRPGVEAYNELGNLLVKLGENDLASKCFREGLRLAPGCESSVPIAMGEQIEKQITASTQMASSEKEPVAQNTIDSTLQELFSSESETASAPEDLQAKKSVT